MPNPPHPTPAVQREQLRPEATWAGLQVTEATLTTWTPSGLGLWPWDHVVPWAPFLAPPGCTKARPEEPGVHLVVGKAEEQEQNSNRLFSSSWPGLPFPGCPPVHWFPIECPKTARTAPLFCGSQLPRGACRGRSHSAPMGCGSRGGKARRGTR